MVNFCAVKAGFCALVKIWSRLRLFSSCTSASFSFHTFSNSTLSYFSCHACHSVIFRMKSVSILSLSCKFKVLRASNLRCTSFVSSIPVELDLGPYHFQIYRRLIFLQFFKDSFKHDDIQPWHLSCYRRQLHLGKNEKGGTRAGW